MTVIKWGDVASIETILTTTLNALASGSNKITASVVSNDAVAELDVYADFELYLSTQGSARDLGAYVEMFLLPLVDGTNPPYGGDSLDPPGTMWVGNFIFDAAVTARYSHLRGILLPPFDFHVLVINETGQALAGTLNTLKMRRYNLEGT